MLCRIRQRPWTTLMSGLRLFKSTVYRCCPWSTAGKPPRNNFQSRPCASSMLMRYDISKEKLPKHTFYNLLVCERLPGNMIKMNERGTKYLALKNLLRSVRPIQTCHINPFTSLLMPNSHCTLLAWLFKLPTSFWKLWTKAPNRRPIIARSMSDGCLVWTAHDAIVTDSYLGSHL